MRKVLPIHNRYHAGVFRWLLIIAILAQLPSTSFAQNVISGTVVSQADGSPLPGVNVVIKNTTIGTATDVDGKYTISAPADATLIFSFIGFTTTEVSVGGRSGIAVTLTGETKTLDDAVVTG